MKIAAIFLGLFLASGVAPAFGQAPAQSQTQPAIGVVDLNLVFTESQSAKTAMQSLEKVKERFDAKLTELGEKSAAAPGENPEAMARLQETLGAFQQEMEGERERLMSIINDGLQKALDALRVKRGLAVLIPREAALSFAPEADVTKAAMDELDALKLDLSPAPSKPEAKQETPSAKPADKNAKPADPGAKAADPKKKP